MGRIFGFILVSVLLCADALGAARVARTTGRAAQYIDPNSYAYMYPYLSNKMRTELNPGVTVSQTNNPIDVLVRTEEMAPPRRVVPRPRTNSTARTATNANTATTTIPVRAATTNATTTTNRRVVPRRTSNNTARATATTGRASVGSTVVPVQSVAGTVSTPRCFADYTSCMNGYCERNNTSYNRCFCSSKLSQINSTYQPKITELVYEIIRLRGLNQWTDEEMNEYWMNVVGNYAGENSWTNLDNALNIEWPSPEERMSGQNAFLIGHEYCIQHLNACAPMAANLRDAYVSKISRDCQTYELGLAKIKAAAESIIESYRE